ncbi:MAG: hypothetical protein ACRDH5_04570, partial [bacterium]
LLYAIVDENSDPAKMLAAVEGIVVLERRPDISPNTLTWVEPADPNDRVTVYGEEELGLFSVKVENSGDFPFWNPNGGTFFCGRPSYDGNDVDFAPDHDDGEPCQYVSNAGLLPKCDTADEAFWAQGGHAADLVCSYKRGGPLQMPVAYTVRRTGDATVVERRELPHDRLWAEDLDKPDAIPPATEKEFFLEMFDRLLKAGEFDVDVKLAHRNAGPVTPSAEESVADNTITETFEVFGVDLRWATPITIIVPALPGCGLALETACPAGAKVRVTTSYRNAGDDEADALARNRDFKAAVYLNDDIIPESVVEDDDDIAPAGETEEVWTGYEFESDPLGGTHRIELRLDHKDNYQFDEPPVDRDIGNVAERVEINQCLPPELPPDNVVCVTLFFADESPPTITDLDIDLEPDAEGLFHILEGEEQVFSASILDNSLDQALALFTYPNGTVETVPMESAPTDEDENRFEVSKAFVGQLGAYVFNVRANDTFGHEAVAAAGLAFVRQILRLQTSLLQGLWHAADDLGLVEVPAA